MNEKGMTFIEVLVAVLILAAGALALAQLFVAGIGINAGTKDDTQISTVAKQQLEAIIESGYSGLVVGGDLHTQVAGYFLDDVKLEDSGTTSNSAIFHRNEVTYDVYWQITDEADIAGVPNRAISVRVVSNRLKFGAASREVTVRTQLTRPYAIL